MTAHKPAAPYRFQVNYEKVFVDGCLKGKRYHDWIRFVDLKSAQDFANKKGQVFGPCAGSLSYRMEFPIIVDLSHFQ